MSYGIHKINIGEKLSTYCIAKCAMSELKAIALHEKTGKWFQEGEIEHTIMRNGMYRNSSDGIITFAVWRDPFDRLVSFYYNKVVNPNTFEKYKKRNGWGKSDIGFDELMEFVRKHLQKPIQLNADEHVRRQSDYYKIDDVDFIVKIEDLTDFLKSYGVEVPEKNINASVKGDDNFEGYRKEIEDLYKADYDILKSDKIWKHI